MGRNADSCWLQVLLYILLIHNDKNSVQIAAPCGPDAYSKLYAGAMDRYLDYWFMMAYDYGRS